MNDRLPLLDSDSAIKKLSVNFRGFDWKGLAQVLRCNYAA
jgi:hypothetical protein